MGISYPCSHNSVLLASLAILQPKTVYCAASQFLSSKSQHATKELGTSFLWPQVSNFMLANRLFCTDPSSFLFGSGSSEFVFKLSDKRYVIVQSFTHFEISRCRLCKGSNVNNNYKLLLRETNLHPSKNIPSKIMTGFSEFAFRVL